MSTNFLHCFWTLSLALHLCILHSRSTSHVYIVYLGVNKFHDHVSTSEYHLQLLTQVFPSENDAKDSMLYSYKRSFSGFSANLNETQATNISKMENVISVFKSKTLRLHTTRSWDFMHLTVDKGEASPLQLAYGHDIVVGIFDTGIWPEAKSFQEQKCMGPIPPCWKGKCVKGQNFEPTKACNRKLIGARYYLKGFEQVFGPLNTSASSEYRSARDFLGHGTHTASTAVGSIVKNASFFGLGKGTSCARGGAPNARLAVYKVCWGLTFEAVCVESDILAAFDDALHDGVHVISASFGSTLPLSAFFDTSTDIGSFHAMQLGVSVVFSAGNDGPEPGLVTNVAPWSLSVAASTIDRTFPTQISLINTDFSITGESLVINEIKGRLADATQYFDNGVCKSREWMGNAATGKIILCFSTLGPIQSSEIAQAAVKKANGTGLIYVEPFTKQIADVDIIPTVHVSIDQGTKIRNYLAPLRKLPLVRISASRTVIGDSVAPTVAYFSSRGPNSLSLDFLKPDISAPGINILAAWPPKTPPTSLPSDPRSVNWNILSGTSMSCPHVAGVVALLKSVHPNWSPAAIRSALMTTAYTKDKTHDTILAGGSMSPSNPFDIGAGHLNPLKAVDPGLVYDMETTDYVLFLCNIGYTQQQIRTMVVDNKFSCSQTQKRSNGDINYPSITVSNLKATTTIKRTLTNVGLKKTAVYFATVVEPHGVEVYVWPRILWLSLFKEEVSYYVSFKAVKESEGRFDFGEIVWSDGFHYVRSPLIVFVNNTIHHSTTSSAFIPHLAV